MNMTRWIELGYGFLVGARDLECAFWLIPPFTEPHGIQGVGKPYRADSFYFFSGLYERGVELVPRESSDAMPPMTVSRT